MAVSVTSGVSPSTTTTIGGPACGNVALNSASRIRHGSLGESNSNVLVLMAKWSTAYAVTDATYTRARITMIQARSAHRQTNRAASDARLLTAPYTPVCAVASAHRRPPHPETAGNPLPRNPPRNPAAVTRAVTRNPSLAAILALKVAVPIAASPPKSHRRGPRHGPPHAEPGRMPRGFQRPHAPACSRARAARREP